MVVFTDVDYVNEHDYSMYADMLATYLTYQAELEESPGFRLKDLHIPSINGDKDWEQKRINFLIDEGKIICVDEEEGYYLANEDYQAPEGVKFTIISKGRVNKFFSAIRGISGICRGLSFDEWCSKSELLAREYAFFIKMGGSFRHYACLGELKDPEYNFSMKSLIEKMGLKYNKKTIEECKWCMLYLAKAGLLNIQVMKNPKYYGKKYVLKKW